MCRPDRLLLLLLAFSVFLFPATMAAPAQAEDEVSLEAVLLKASGSGTEEPSLDKLAKNVEKVLKEAHQFKNYGDFDTTRYEVENLQRGSSYKVDLKKKLPKMNIEIKPGEEKDGKISINLVWKEDNKTVVRQTNYKVGRDKWLIINYNKDDATSYLLLVRVGQPFEDLKAERKKRGLPEEKKKEEE